MVNGTDQATLVTTTLPAGSDNIVATYSGDQNYGQSTGSTTEVVNQATPVLTLSDPGGPYDGAPYAATYTIAGVTPSDNTPGPSLENVASTLTYYDASGNQLSAPPTDVGSYSVQVSFPGSQDYTSATETVSFAITPAELTVTANDVTMTYADGTQLDDVNGFTVSGLVGSDSVSSVTLTTNATINNSDNWDAGTWAITPSNATGSFNPSDYNITYINGTLTVNQAELTVTAADVTMTYADGTWLDPFTEFSATGLVGGDEINWVTLTPDATVNASGNWDAGTWTITVSSPTSVFFNPADYNITYVTGTLTINRADLTITANDVTMTYADGTQFDGVNGFSPSGLVGGDAIDSVTLKTNAALSGSGNGDAGTWSITPSSPVGAQFHAADYSITYVGGTLTVNQASLTIGGVSGTNKPYDGNTSDPISGTPVLIGLAPGDNVTIDSSGATASFEASPDTSPGLPVIFSGYAINGPDAGNYILTQPNGSSANITPAPITITIGHDTEAYGTVANFSNDLPSNLHTGINGEYLTVAVYSSSGDNSSASPGTYAITAILTSGSGLYWNYDVTLIDGTLTVT